MYQGDQNVVRGFGGKPDGKRPLGTPRHRWEFCIKIDLQVVVLGAWAASLSANMNGGLSLVRAEMNLLVD